MDVLTIGSFAFFTGLVGLATYLLTRGDDHESPIGYFLAGRRLTGGVIAGSLLLTNLSTEQLVGINGQAFTDGLSVMAWEVIAAVALVCMGLFFLPRYLKSGVATLPQFLEERFDSRTRTIASLIFIVAYATILLPIILYTGATGLSGILNLSEMTGFDSDIGVLWLTVLLIGILGSVYAIFGGLRTVAVSDTLNGFGLLVGGVLIAYFGLLRVAGEQGSPLAGWSVLRNAMPEKFNSIGAPDQHVPFSTLFTGVFLLHVFYWCTNQQIIQRTLGASSLREGQRGVLIAATMKILAPIIIVIPGMIAAYLYSDGVVADKAYGTLVRDVLPPSLVGFFAAVIVGAVLSTYNSVLNSTATLFSLGVYQKHINPGASQRQIIQSGKWCGAAVAVFAMATAPLLAKTESIFGYMAKMNGLYSIPIFAVVLVGILSKYVPALAANTALLTGLVLIGLRYFAFDEVALWLHEFHFLGIVFALLVVLMLIIGRLRPRSEPYQQQYSGEVDLTPWRWAKPGGAGIVLVVLGIYVYFADFSILSK
ncbi:MAG: solute:sodium symporter family transporter [Planctomycetales bacterium]|nr:solute:sodium symporter family transporter [Planctomycetales bacterium]